MNNWKNIRLELAPTERFPTGSVSRGYLIRLPLDDRDLIDRAAYDLTPYLATVRRYWSTEPDEAGRVLPLEDSWKLECKGKQGRMLEVDGRPLRLGQQIKVIETDGTSLPFRIASVR